MPFLHLAFKNALLKPIGEFGLSEHWLSQTPCTAPCNKHCAFPPHNWVSVDWLYCQWASGPKFGSVTAALAIIVAIFCVDMDPTWNKARTCLYILSWTSSHTWSPLSFTSAHTSTAGVCLQVWRREYICSVPHQPKERRTEPRRTPDFRGGQRREDLKGNEKKRPMCGGQEAQEEPGFTTWSQVQMLQVIEDRWNQPSSQGCDSLWSPVALACGGFKLDFGSPARDWSQATAVRTLNPSH